MRVVFIAALAACVFQGCTSDDRATGAADLLLANVVVISPGGVPSPRMDVIVENGRILSVEKSAPRRSGFARKTIDGSGKFLIPGLIDGHTHLNEVPGMNFEHERSYPDISSAARSQIPRSYLYHGFTTVVDLNSTPGVIEQWNSLAVRPQAYFCGASPVFDGYPMSWMPKPARYDIMPYFLFDESRSAEFPEGFDPSRHTPTAVVDRIRADGGICVKTHYERGFGGRGDLPVPTAALVKALVGAAHAKKLPLLMHANSESAQSFGVDTGIDAFAHGMWTWNDRLLTEIHTDIEEIVNQTIVRDIALQPTIQVLYGEQDIHNPDYLDDPRLKRVLPGGLIDWYRTDDGQWWRRRMLQVPIVSQLVEQGLWQELDAPPIARVSAVLEHFASNGGRLLFGSDTPSDPTFANPPGLNGRMEMDRWIAASVTPEQLFLAATVNNANFFGLGDEIGTIEAGKRADLLLLGENPLDSVSAYDTIEQVILRGVVLHRSSLAADAD
ncbi:MAG: amidohydrolase family protein [Gammaproteobacteria bacterium]|nr:amidohydrolase family protein [Gammaproteobacteria bacterium]